MHLFRMPLDCSSYFFENLEELGCCLGFHPERDQEREQQLFEKIILRCSMLVRAWLVLLRRYKTKNDTTNEQTWKRVAGGSSSLPPGPIERMPREVVDQIALLLDPALDLPRRRLATLPVPKSVFTKGPTMVHGCYSCGFDLDSSESSNEASEKCCSDEA